MHLLLRSLCQSIIVEEGKEQVAEEEEEVKGAEVAKEEVKFEAKREEVSTPCTCV